MSYAPLADSPIQRADFYIANGDGTNRQPLLEHRGTFESYDHPAWPLDGNWIYFTRYDVLIDDDQGTAESVVNIERIPEGGGEIVRITSWGTDGAVLAWSPDGENLALMHQGGSFVTGEAEPTLLVETPDHGGIDWAKIAP